MISRGNRFHGRGGIQRLYKNGKAVRSGALALRYNPNNRDSYRLSVVVSRKISKSAVVRNRIRRRIYENVRILSSAFSTPHDLLLIVYDEKIAHCEPEKLTQEIVNLLEKAKLTSAASPNHAIVSAKE